MHYLIRKRSRKSRCSWEKGGEEREGRGGTGIQEYHKIEFNVLTKTKERKSRKTQLHRAGAVRLRKNLN